MKNKIHSLIVEGIVFCGSGLVLLSYSLSSYAKGFNKSWAQSPYLFPLIVALAMIGLSLWIVGEGVTAMKKEAAVPNDRKVSKAEKTEKRRWVVIALILCVLYYAALAFVNVPYVTIGILSFAYTFSTFEVVTIVFLIAMMIFMGVRKIPVLVFVPIGTTLFLSLAFRTFLHVLLP
nr:tripartite tricarboxylate transporter TctB family protein [Clostridium sp. Marseille-P7770]